jgi:hypothetical protein
VGKACLGGVPVQEVVEAGFFLRAAGGGSLGAPICGVSCGGNISQPEVIGHVEYVPEASSFVCFWPAPASPELVFTDTSAFKVKLLSAPATTVSL